MVVLIILVAALTVVIVAAVTWTIAHRKSATANPGAPAEVVDDDPTPVVPGPSKNASGPTPAPTWSAVIDRIPLGVVVMGSVAR